jgi:hypothetical protein
MTYSLATRALEHPKQSSQQDSSFTRNSSKHQQWRQVEKEVTRKLSIDDKISIFPVGIPELDRQIILEAKVSDVINMYYVSQYFRDILEDPYTFSIFKLKYPFTVMTSFQDFLILNEELKKTTGKIYSIGDRVFTGTNNIYHKNYKIVNIDHKNYVLFLQTVNMLGIIINRRLIKASALGHFKDENNNIHHFQKGIIKHELGPKIISVDSPYLLYKTNPLNPNFHSLRKKYPSEENYKLGLDVGLVSTIEYKDINGTVRFPYVIDKIYDDDIILKFIGIGTHNYLFRSSIVPPNLVITYDHEKHRWYSREYGNIILTPGDWRENLVDLSSIYG